MNITSTELKKRNYSLVFHYIYERKTVSRNDIAKDLNLSIPTVINSLNELMKEGLITREGIFQSTGGRPAFMYRCNENSRLSIGLEILQDRVEIAAVNIYGRIIESSSMPLRFSADDSYYRQLGTFVNTFSKKRRNGNPMVLGVGISLPAIVNRDNGAIVYSELLDSRAFNVDDLTRHIELECQCRHDAECGAYAKLWNRRLKNDTLIIFLNNYMCTAFVINGMVHVSRDLSSGTLEHLVIHENGRRCYCQKCGCADAYCSANSLLKRSGFKDFDSFFKALRSSDVKACSQWDSYLDDLALTIDNARMVIPCDIIIDGFLLKYIQDQDIETLKNKILERTTFKQIDFSVTKGECNSDPVLTGSALPLLREFLNSI